MLNQPVAKALSSSPLFIDRQDIGKTGNFEDLHDGVIYTNDLHFACLFMIFCAERSTRRPAEEM